MDINQLFYLGMKRVIAHPIPVGNFQVNLGSGNSPIAGATNLDLPEWDANKDIIPFDDESVDTVHAYHFLEHVNNPVKMLHEIQRVLKPGGTANICVPYYKSQMAYHDLTHKTFWTEETFRQLLSCPYYGDRTDWKFTIHICVIIGLVERNLALLVQLVREQ